MSFADLDEIETRSRLRWRPPPRLRLSDWAGRNFYLSSESSAIAGRFHPIPYQVEMLDAMADPLVEMVTIMKSSRVGYTICITAAIAYFIAQDPASMLVVQPTVDDAKGFSKETIAPMLRDVPALGEILFRDSEEKGPKDSSATLRHKQFPGGVLSLIGANSGAGFRRVSRRVVMFDEVDAYPASAGAEGDPINLGIKRTEAFHNRKIISGSTPLIAGSSRIEEMFSAGDQRRFHVPCPQCGHQDIFVFSEGKSDRGHFMKWPEGHPEQACFVCRANGCIIEHHRKRWMVERGEWRADRPGGRHRSYHIWAAYSYSPNATWGHIAAEFLAAKRGGPEKLKTFFNTTLGETWVERGEAPDWERLHDRRETYDVGTVPAGARFLTAGVDVQRDRLIFEVVGWGPGKESWSIDAGALWGDTALDTTWNQLDALIARTYPGPAGDMPIRMTAVDSGDQTQTVYGWARGKPRVMAVKGMKGRTLLGAPTKVDVTVHGRKISSGVWLWPVAPDIAKSELYGFLGLRIAQGAEPPPGYCHFPEYGEEFFKELTAEHLVSIRRRSGVTVLEWHVIANRPNHGLDARVYARAAASRLGLDRMKPKEPRPASSSQPPPAAEEQTSPPPEEREREPVSAPPAARPEPSPPPRPRPTFFGGRPRQWFGKGR